MYFRTIYNIKYVPIYFYIPTDVLFDTERRSSWSKFVSVIHKIVNGLEVLSDIAVTLCILQIKNEMFKFWNLSKGWWRLLSLPPMTLLEAIISCIKIKS